MELWQWKRRPWPPSHRLRHHHPHCTLLVPPTPLGRSLLGEVAVFGEGLGLFFLDKLATIVFPLLIRAFHNKVAHIATIIASPHSLLDLRTT